MKTPSRKRPRPQALAVAPSSEDLAAWAATVRYVGSPEHKTYPSFAGRPKLRSDATPCPTEYKDADMICGWLRNAILQGNVSAFRDQECFPRYVWAKLDGTWFEARLVNATAGTYKGYPVTEASIPRELRERLS
ncbi:hypothetical protein [Tessaracoccus caeni]|uniref:hypothetical protein n=1 Tax=Tessaracoccus caeni TaxID=3031239 RepID=UPI0023D9892D|nr:hypothetical protein [Tessaracoccus caeni]MDF1489426.1 hypothetical protein [Tessaracoccus caeni]